MLKKVEVLASCSVKCRTQTPFSDSLPRLCISKLHSSLRDYGSLVEEGGGRMWMRRCNDVYASEAEVYEAARTPPSIMLIHPHAPMIHTMIAPKTSNN